MANVSKLAALKVKLNKLDQQYIELRQANSEIELSIKEAAAGRQRSLRPGGHSKDKVEPEHLSSFQNKTDLLATFAQNNLRMDRIKLEYEKLVLSYAGPHQPLTRGTSGNASLDFSPEETIRLAELSKQFSTAFSDDEKTFTVKGPFDPCWCAGCTNLCEASCGHCIGCTACSGCSGCGDICSSCFGVHVAQTSPK